MGRKEALDEEGEGATRGTSVGGMEAPARGVVNRRYPDCARGEAPQGPRLVGACVDQVEAPASEQADQAVQDPRIVERVPVPGPEGQPDDRDARSTSRLVDRR